MFRLHKQIMDIGGSKLKVAQQRVDTVNGQIDLVTGEITKLNVSIKTAQRYFIFVFIWLIGINFYFSLFAI